MKKKVTLILTCIVLSLAFISCGNAGTANQKKTLPTDGIVKAAEFEALKGNSVIGIFGDADGRYQWTFLGTEISECFDANLTIEFDQTLSPDVDAHFEGERSLSLRVPSPKTIPGKPSVTIKLDGWENQSAYLYLIRGIDIGFITRVRVLDGMASFALPALGGVYVVSFLAPIGGGGEEENSRPPDELPLDDSATPHITITITCHNAVKNWDNLKESVKDERIVPSSGIIYPVTPLYIKKGDSVFDALVSVVRANKIHMEYNKVPIYNSVYIKGINNLYEFDGGNLSGWMYCVNGWYPNYGASRYKLKDGDVLEWNYTCDLGRDLGQNLV